MGVRTLLQVHHVFHGHNAHVEQLLGVQGPLWGRQYCFWHQVC